MRRYIAKSILIIVLVGLFLPLASSVKVASSWILRMTGSSGLLLIILVLMAQRWRSYRSENMRLRKELDDARRMQVRLLPKKVPLMKGFDVAGLSHPAREVGGDFFSYLPLTDGRTGIAVADVSGKGLKGAMNAILVDGMLHEVATIETSCGKILSRLNADLHPRIERHMFTTLGLAVLDQDTEILQWASAGHHYPIIRRDGQVFEFESENGLPLGVMPEVAYSDHELGLQSGDVVVFYTDGIIEAENKAEEMYGNERLRQVIEHMNLIVDAESIAKAILLDVSNFAGNTEQYDDMTIVVTKKL